MEWSQFIAGLERSMCLFGLQEVWPSFHGSPLAPNFMEESVDDGESNLPDNFVSDFMLPLYPVKNMPGMRFRS